MRQHPDTSAQQLLSLIRLVQTAFTHVAMEPELCGRNAEAAMALMKTAKDPKVIADIVAIHLKDEGVRQLEIMADAVELLQENDKKVREQLHGQMADAGYDLPSLLDSDSR